MIFLKKYFDTHQVLFSKFPNREVKLHNIDELAKIANSFTKDFKILFIYESDQDLINLMILKNWLDVNYSINNNFKHNLEIYYMPYSRMDRKINEHEPTLHLILNFLKYLNFNSYTVYDPHSSEELYKYLKFNIVTQLECIQYRTYIEDVIKKNKNITVLVPDKGAEKKSLEIANHFNLSFIIANKTRDVVTGNITNTQILGDVKDKDLFIFDDIIDGGATFIELAKKAKENGANDLYLYATHGIFSKGTFELEKYFKHIYVFHTFLKECDSENVTILTEGL